MFNDPGSKHAINSLRVNDSVPKCRLTNNR